MQEKGVCKERHVTVCKQMRLCREIVKKVRLFKQDELEDKITLRKHVLSYLLLRQKSLALAAFVNFFFLAYPGGGLRAGFQKGCRYSSLLL